jgi:hypothetical protein
MSDERHKDILVCREEVAHQCRFFSPFNSLALDSMAVLDSRIKR